MQPIIRAILLFDDRTLQNRATFQHVGNVLAFPTASTDDNQLGRGIAHALHQCSPYMQDEPVIFARLNRAEHHKIGGIENRGRGRSRCDARRKVSNNGRRKPKSRVLGFCAQRVQSGVRVGDQSVSVCERGVDSTPMNLVDPGAAIFGMGQRNQVVHHEYSTCTSFRHRPVITVEFHSIVAGVEQNGIGQSTAVLSVDERISQQFRQHPAIAVC